MRVHFIRRVIHQMTHLQVIQIPVLVEKPAALVEYPASPKDTPIFLKQATRYYLMLKKTILLLLLMFPTSLLAYKYGEHKEIGDKAFIQFLQQMGNSPYAATFLQYLGIRTDSVRHYYYFQALTGEDKNPVSYGVINALSGDHESNPLLLEEQLQYRYSVLQRIISLHEQYIAIGYSAAPDNKLTKADFSYALQAALNISHFYEYNKSFTAQLRFFNKKTVKEIENPSRVPELFRHLGHTNALNMYVTLHTMAIDLAEQSGRLAKTGDTSAGKLLFYAFLFNGFADHFLEDAFAAGHLVVNRTILASVTNKKALQEFYCKNGCTVVNKKGEIWHAYGDGKFNDAHNSWTKATSLQNITYPAYTPESERVINAVTLSLQDLWAAYQKTYMQDSYTPFLQTIPDDKKSQPLFLINHIPSLALVPIPYNSDLAGIMGSKSAVTPEMKQANRPLYYRNFVRSRVANSLVIGISNSSYTDDNYRSLDLRLNIGNFSNNYSLNRKGGKKGTFDYWLGYTASYSFGRLTGVEYKGSKENIQQARVGIRGNFDLWITDRKFIGIYNYTEAGVAFINSKANFVFAPTIGLQLASLINLNYYNMPIWLRIPAQYFLPLKLSYGALIVPHQRTRYYSGLEMDIFF
jgi:hypothetical protein